MKIVRWTIYKITNPRGNIYIGKTKNFTTRMKLYKSGHEKGEKRIICKSINKYGFDNHKIEIIDDFNGSLSEANSKEIFWIRTYMSNKSKYPYMNGMNLTDGGEGLLGAIHSFETRKKISISISGKKKSDSHRLSMSINNAKYWLGKKRPKEYVAKTAFKNNGQKRTLEQKERISKSHIGLASGNRKAVCQFSKNGELVGEYNSLSDAASVLGCARSGISNNLSGVSKHCNGFVFKYKEKEKAA